jgi:hypothetical protein
MHKPILIPTAMYTDSLCLESTILYKNQKCVLHHRIQGFSKCVIEASFLCTSSLSINVLLHVQIRCLTK